MHDIREAKKNADYVIVIYHGGKEHCEYPSPRLLRLCREMIECGANVVLTQHSHCIGSYEEYEGGHILYGQGNFHFPHTDDVPANWYQGLLVELNITKEKLDIVFHPFVLNGAQIYLAKGEEYDAIMNPFYERNKTIKNGEWKKGWLEFVQTEKREQHHS
jgi:poly-gamma-glutamate synthesis protein (capsule biosynthesis protein)